MQRALFVAVFSIPHLVLFREWSLVSQPRKSPCRREGATYRGRATSSDSVEICCRTPSATISAVPFSRLMWRTWEVEVGGRHSLQGGPKAV